MKEIQLFNHKMFGNIRTTTDEQGEPLFVGKDVAVALGYRNTRKALHDHVDKEDKGVTKRATPGGEQSMVMINESGLYSLMFTSKLPQAKAFKRWVTSEVLPQIRKTGGYISTKDASGHQLSDQEILELALQIQQKTIDIALGIDVSQMPNYNNELKNLMQRISQ